jgi:hypothetical protein
MASEEKLDDGHGRGSSRLSTGWAREGHRPFKNRLILGNTISAFHYRDYVHFDFDEIGVDAEHGCAERLEEHPKMPFESSIPEEGVSSCSTVGESLSQNGT